MAAGPALSVAFPLPSFSLWQRSGGFRSHCVLEEKCLTALLPWTPSVAAPRGWWCHSNRQKHDARGYVFLSSLSASLFFFSSHPACDSSQWSKLITSATSKISLLQPLSHHDFHFTLSVSLSLSLHAIRVLSLMWPAFFKFKMAASDGWWHFLFSKWLN